MPKLKDAKQRSFTSVLIFGGPKSGKTKLAGELAEDGYDIIYVGCENGHETLMEMSEGAKDRVSIIDIPDTKESPRAIDTCLKLATGKSYQVCVEHGRINCPLCKKNGDELETHEFNSNDHNTVVVFDSLSQIVESAKALIAKGQPSGYKFEFDDWANLGTLINELLGFIQQARFHVVVISHEDEIDTAEGKTIIAPVGGTRKASRNTAKYFGHVIYTTKRNKKHIAASSSLYANNIQTGSRGNIVFDQDDNPRLSRIFDRYKSGGQKAVDSASRAVDKLAKAKALAAKSK